MSKSLNNYIAIDETKNEMFGKIMSIPDSLVFNYFELLTGVSLKEIRALEKGVAEGTLHPKEAKKRLGREIVAMYHTREDADLADAEFERVFSSKKLPSEIPELEIASGLLKEGRIWIVNLLMEAKAVANKSEAKRLVDQGGVYLNDKRVERTDLDIPVKTGDVLKAGKRKFFRLKV